MTMTRFLLMLVFLTYCFLLPVTYLDYLAH
jgi:hypothetical protein